MADKTPLMLVVLVEVARLRWFVAAVDLDGQATTLLRSEEGNLEKYRGLDFDEQVAFLRHRFCGVLQQGCDRAWARDAKACQFVFVFDASLPEATGTLTQLVAEHFAQWMLRPPAVTFLHHNAGESSHLERLAGEIEAPLEKLLVACLPALEKARERADDWELAVPRKAPP